jgi:ribosomal protein L25 (general stress protein Ctc)
MNWMRSKEFLTNQRKIGQSQKFWVILDGIRKREFLLFVKEIAHDAIGDPFVHFLFKL